MRTPQLNRSDTFIQQKSKVWIILACLVGFSILSYYGYCFGIWGRHSLLLQYLFQCKCPAGTEERRYPKEIDVLVSACRRSWVDLSPSGRFLAVAAYQSDNTLNLTYLLNLQT